MDFEFPLRHDHPTLERMRAHIVDVPNHPRPGITFKDITPLLGEPRLYRAATQIMAQPWRAHGITAVVAGEARGFMVGAPLAQALGAGFIPARKLGKLPRETHQRKYKLEYGEDGLEIHKGILTSLDCVLIADDLLATGGTALAMAEMVKETGATLLGFSFLITLTGLDGYTKLRELYGDCLHEVLRY